jgi:hypothetical protein
MSNFISEDDIEKALLACLRATSFGGVTHSGACLRHSICRAGKPIF